MGNLRLQNARFEDSKLRADVFGDLDATYNNQPLRLRGVVGRLEQPSGKALTLTATVQNAAGRISNNDFRAESLRGRYTLEQGLNSISFAANRAFGTISGIETSAQNISGVLNLRGAGLGLQASAAKATAKTTAGTITAQEIRANANGSATNLPIQFNASQLEALGLDAQLVLNNVRGTVTSAKNLGFALEFQNGNLLHPEATAALQKGQITGRLAGQDLQTRFLLPAKLEARGEGFSAALRGALALNLEQPSKNWIGNLNAKLSGKDWSLQTSGTWQNLTVSGYLPSRLSKLAGFDLPFKTNLALSGTASLPDLRYNLGVFAKLQGLELAASIKGSSADFAAKLNLKDQQQGRGQISYTSSGNANMQLQNLTISGLVQTSARVSSKLSLNGERLRGTLSGEIAGLPLEATWLENDKFNAELGGVLPVRLSSQKWRFPLNAILEFQSLKTELPIALSGSFDLAKLRGQGVLALQAYSQNLGAGQLSVQAQTMPFAVAADSGLRLRLENRAGSLVFNQNWSGALGLGYTAFRQNGTVLARLSGELANPTFALETTGWLDARASGDLQNAKLSGRAGLTPLVALLPQDLQKNIQAGSAQLEATWAKETLGFAAVLQNSRLEQENVRLKLGGQWQSAKPTWQLSGEAGVGSSLTQFRASQAGLNAQKLDLDLRLLRLFGINASGRITGNLNLPDFSLERLTAELRASNTQAYGISANGTVLAQNGQISSTLRGQTSLDLDYILDGAVYPNLNAALRLGKLEDAPQGCASTKQAAKPT